MHLSRDFVHRLQDHRASLGSEPALEGVGDPLLDRCIWGRLESGDVCLDFIRARSYIGETSSGVVEIMHAPEVLIRDRHVLLVEDILDTGRTASQIIAWLKERGPASLRVCALIDKPARRLVEVRADYVGFSIEDHFVVGYGLDHNEQYRHLPSVYTLDTNEV
ncbi:MAG TPA: phosphoribosyltransferase family protein [Candidatus Hydrogenedentes bacterium]|nr:phosphoribosyltransferase family protein [Candidatus Hydrogenedentota bacterium]